MTDDPMDQPEGTMSKNDHIIMMGIGMSILSGAVKDFLKSAYSGDINKAAQGLMSLKEAVAVTDEIAKELIGDTMAQILLKETKK